MTENPVDRTFYGRIPIRKASSFLYFHENGIVRNLMHHLKYRKQPQIGDFLGRWYGQILNDDPGLPAVDLVIPVPLHPGKLRKRGYNQVTGFGRELAAKLGTSLREDILEKVAQTPTQTHRSRIFRWKHQSPQFRVSEGVLPEDKKVLLIDDVITTGATLEACTKALKSAANVEVYIATMAMVP